MHDVAAAVAEHLHLDVTRVHQKLLHVERGVAERGVGFSRRLHEHLLQLFRPAGNLDPTAASAGRGLHHYRVAELRSGGEGLLGRGRSVGSRHRRHVRLAGKPACERLVPHPLDR
jgi:hypothetical protein